MLAGVCTLVGVLSPPLGWSSPARMYAGVAYRGESEGDSLGVSGPPTPLKVVNILNRKGKHAYTYLSTVSMIFTNVSAMKFVSQHYV